MNKIFLSVLLIIFSFSINACKESAYKNHRIIEKGLITEQGIKKDIDIDFSMNKTVSLGSNDGFGAKLELENITTNKKITIHNCNDYFSALNNENYPSGTFSITMEGFFIEYCNPLLFLKQARSSKHSNFTPPFFHKNSLEKLPSNMGNIYQVNRHPPCDDYKNLNECFVRQVDGYSFNNVRISSNNIDIETDTDTAGFKVLAKGDVNHDGWQDLLISYRYAVYNASYRKYGVFCLEWSENQKSPHMFECLNKKF